MHAKMGLYYQLRSDETPRGSNIVYCFVDITEQRVRFKAYREENCSAE